MGNPNTPAPLEAVAAEYMFAALKGEGFLQFPETNSTARNFYRLLARGLIHFFLDHMYVAFDGELEIPAQTVSTSGGQTVNIPAQSIQVDLDALINRIANHPDAWKNEPL